MTPSTDPREQLALYLEAALRQNEVLQLLPPTNVAYRTIQGPAFPENVYPAVSVEEAKEKLGRWRHLGYTSFNHLKDGKTHKFRVVLPLKTPITRREWERRKEGFLKFFAGTDLSTFSWGRVFFSPAASEDPFCTPTPGT